MYCSKIICMILCLNCVYVTLCIKLSEVRNNLGTRTPYRFRYNKNDSKVAYSDCRDVKIWMLIRHGTRLPNSKEIVAMNTTLRQLKDTVIIQHQLRKGLLNDEQIGDFKKWETNINVDNAHDLTSEGEEEMVLLAERMQKRFPNAIKQKYSNDSFLFRYTPTQRAQQSARYFTIGLFDKKKARDVYFYPGTKADPVLRFYKHCDKWQTQVKKNASTYEETRIFSTGQTMNDTLEAMSKRLGLDIVLTIDEGLLIYKVCGYETSWHKHLTSPWCAAFDEKSIQVFAYLTDLKHYWLDGYGFEITYKPACLSLKNMFENFRKDKGPQAAFHFTHSGTLLKVLTHLKLYKPTKHLRGQAIDNDRTWRTSEIDVFASNLAFVLFKCDGDYKVLTLHQERPIKLPPCDTELCPLEKIREYFKESIFDCDYTDICSLPKVKTD